MMKSRVVTALSLLVTFLLGMLTYQPVARAMEALVLSHCSSKSACAAYVNASKGTGLTGISNGGNGVEGWTRSKYGAGVIGQDRSGASAAGVFGISKAGTGVEGDATSGVGVIATSLSGFGLQASTVASGASAAALGVYSGYGGDMIQGSGSRSTLTVDTNANVTITGKIFTDGSCSTGCIARHRVRSYGMSSAVPTIEDNGEARLVRGSASVRLDPAFANAIDLAAGYIVQLTPEGDTKGLYVASRTPAGFAVRETMGGRASLAFAYRIVGHAFGVRADRLPFIEERAPAAVGRQ